MPFAINNLMDTTSTSPGPARMMVIVRVFCERARGPMAARGPAATLPFFWDVGIFLCMCVLVDTHFYICLGQA